MQHADKKHVMITRNTAKSGKVPNWSGRSMVYPVLLTQQGKPFPGGASGTMFLITAPVPM